VAFHHSAAATLFRAVANSVGNRLYGARGRRLTWSRISTLAPCATNHATTSP